MEAPPVAQPTTTAQGVPSAFWEVDVGSLLRQLDTSRNGLSGPEAARRLERYGPNELAVRRRWNTVIQFLAFFTNPLVLVLICASTVSAFLGEAVNAVIIIVIVTISAGLNFVQAFRSQRAAEALREQVSLTALAIRDGRPTRIPRRDVVPGDILLLSAGDVVPADGRLLEAKDLTVNEASLTGESLPVEKYVVDSVPERASTAQAINAVFLGTSVISGSATVLAVKTGPTTEFGRIAERLAARMPETEFERGTRQFAFLITRTIFFLVLFVFLVNIVLERDPLESFLFAIALAVGLTPELLPMIMSVTLARGAVLMSRKRVIVKQLAAIQNFGSMDILCSDKTGTLTAGTVVLDRHIGPFGDDEPEVLRLAYLNSFFETGIKSALEQAILASGPEPVDGIEKVDEVPFDFTRRRLSVVLDDHTAGRRFLIARGAPEGILAGCSRYLATTEHPMTPEARARIDSTFQNLSAAGYRALGIAVKDVEVKPTYGRVDEVDMTFVGFVTFLDPPKPDAGDAIRALAGDGVRVKIFTGDNELVTRHVCEKVGLDPGEILLGEHLDRLTDEALGAVAERTVVFARVSPEQKNRLIHALRARHHVVGFLGDGINDAPSLHTADVGISVANAVEVARESASIILLAHDLGVLHDGVIEGRRSFGNVMKYILMGTSSNFGNMFSMAGATVFLPFLPMLPMQILLNNLLYDVSQVTLPEDHVDPVYVRKPHHWNIGIIQRFMLVMGPISSLYDFATFAVMLGVLHASETLFHTGWFIESLTTQILVIYVIRTSGNPFRSRPSTPVFLSTLGCVALGWLLTFSPLAPTLGFVRPPLLFFAFLGAIVVAYLSLVQFVKTWFYRRYTAAL